MDNLAIYFHQTIIELNSEGSGIVWPSSRAVSIHSSFAVSISFNAFSFVSPCAMHPGSSGMLTAKISSTGAYVYLATPVPLSSEPDLLYQTITFFTIPSQTSFSQPSCAKNKTLSLIYTYRNPLKLASFSRYSLSRHVLLASLVLSK